VTDLVRNGDGEGIDDELVPGFAQGRGLDVQGFFVAERCRTGEGNMSDESATVYAGSPHDGGALLTVYFAGYLPPEAGGLPVSSQRRKGVAEAGAEF
jgi:hypothetical protein